MIHIENTELAGVLRVRSDTFRDHRGEFSELYNEVQFRTQSIEINFVEDDISISHKNVLRGIHGDHQTWKLVSCIFGGSYFVAIDCREDLSSFGKWLGFHLNSRSVESLLVPPGFGIAHLAKNEPTIVLYKQSRVYNPAGQFTYRWNDPRFAISWPCEAPILSDRDRFL